LHALRRLGTIMAIDPRQFWGSNHYKHPPLTDEMIATAHALLPGRLPSAFIALLRIQNGGYTMGFAHPMVQRTSWAIDHVPLDSLGGIVVDTAHETALNILHSEYMTQEWGLPPKQVLLSGDGHYWIALDYRKSGTPSVAWIDVECDEDIQIAATFDSFLSGLLPASTFVIDS
jgi:SMI1-KNR4 cell-wall